MHPRLMHNLLATTASRTQTETFSRHFTVNEMGFC